MSIRTKVLLILTALIAIPGILFGSIIYVNARTTLTDLRIQQLETLASLKKSRVETFFDEWKADIRSVQLNPDIAQYAPVLIAAQGDKQGAMYRHAYSELEEQLQAIQGNYGYLNMYLVDPDGRIVYANDWGRDAIGRTLRPAAEFVGRKMKDIYFSDVFRRSSGPGGFSMIGAVPLSTPNGVFTGSLIIERDMRPIFDFVAERTGLGKTGEIVLTRRDGDSVLFLTPLNDDPGAALVKRIGLSERNAYPSQRAVQGHTGSGVALDYAGKEVLAAWDYMPTLRWGIVTKISADEAFTPVTRLRVLVIVLGIVTLLLGGYVSVVTAESIIGPILKLQQGTEVIGSGDLDHKVGTDAPDEVGQLSRLIDTMTARLKKVTASRDELDAEVAVRTKAERSLVEQSRVLEAYFKHALSPLVFLDREFNFLRVNEAYARVCSRDVGYFRGRNHFAEYPSDDLKQKFEGVVATGLPYYVAARPFVFPDHPEWGTSYWDLMVNPVKDDEGNVDFLVFSLFDVTERQEAEVRKEVTSEILKLFTKKSTRREYLDAVIEQVSAWCRCSHAGIRITGQNGSIPFSSYRGYDPSFLGQESCLSLGKDDCICTRIISGEPAPADRAFLTASGSYVSNDAVRFLDGIAAVERRRYRAVCMQRGYASLAVIPIRYRDAVIGALHVADEQQDRLPLKNVEFLEQITLIIGEAVYRFDIEDELRRNYDALQASEARYRTLVEDIRDIIFTVSPEGIVVSLNKAFEDIIGFRRDALIGAHFSSLLHPEDLPRADELLAKIITGEAVPLFELRARTLSGEYRTIEFKIAQERTADGMILGTARDVTERKQAEEERARLFSAVQAAAEAIVITHPATGDIQYANPAYEQMTGYALTEIIGRTLHFLESGTAEDGFFEGIREELGRNGVWTGRLTNRKKDGTLYFEDCTISPVKNRQGDIINYIYVKRDVTERMQLESVAEAVNMMDNIGSVFSGVRHEIGNPINAMNMVLGLLRDKLDSLPPDAVRDYLARLAEQVSRIEFLLRSLKSFNLYETQMPQHLPLQPFLDNFLLLIREDLTAKGIRIETTTEPGLAATADPRALQQVLLNVINNAAEAARWRKDPMVSIDAERANERVRIRISDNGTGIREEQMKNIFKPFYTTKEGGTGLGLVIVRKMLAGMGGSIELTGRAGGGTTVEIHIPGERT